MVPAQPALDTSQESLAANLVFGNQPPPNSVQELPPELPAAPKTPMGRVFPATWEHRGDSQAALLSSNARRATKPPRTTRYTPPATNAASAGGPNRTLPANLPKRRWLR